MLEATVDGRAAIDLVCDLVSVSALVEALAPARITASPIALSATPLVNDGALAPGPSTWVLHALAGLRTVERDLPWECTTPTGAALLWTLAGAGERRPPLAFHHIGTGLGTREAPGVVNATRALYAERRTTVDDGAVMRIEAVLDAAVDRARLVRELEVKGAHDITFARVEDAQGMPLFRIDALVDTHGGDDEVRAVMKTLDDAGRAVASFAGRRLTSPVRIVTVPVGKGAKQTPVRMRIKGHEENAAPVDEDVRRGARRLRVDEDRVRALATEAFLRLAGERESSAPVDEHGGGEDE